MPEVSTDEFAQNLVKMGVDITAYDSNDLLYLKKVASHCLKNAGIPLGATAGLAMSGVGSVTIPVLGAVPGYVAGFLAGALGGTFACTISRISVKRSLDQLLSDSSPAAKNRVINSY